MFCTKDTSRAASIRDSFHRLERICRKLPKPVFDSYRPEKHYMRGPGPKHRAKWGGGADISPVNQTMRGRATVRDVQLLADLRSVDVR
jgi:hypothetical protein